MTQHTLADLHGAPYLKASDPEPLFPLPRWLADEHPSL